MENDYKKYKYYLYYIELGDTRGPYRLKEALRIKNNSWAEVKLLIEIIDENGRCLYC